MMCTLAASSVRYMRKTAAVLALLTGCYRTTEWGATGEYRGENTRTDEEQVGSEETATFDETGGLRVTVVAHDLCRPLMLGDHLQRQEESTSELQGTGWMVGTGVTLGLCGMGLTVFGADDTSTTDEFGYPRTPHFSAGADEAMIIIGSAAVLAGIAEIVLVVALPSSRRASRWTALPEDTHRVFTSSDTQPCNRPSHPAVGVAVHVDALFEHGESLGWDIPTDASGTAAIDLDRVRKISGWCGGAHVTAKVGHQSWEGQIEAAPKVPVDQITDEKARALAAACGSSDPDRR